MLRQTFSFRKVLKIMKCYESSAEFLKFIKSYPYSVIFNLVVRVKKILSN